MREKNAKGVLYNFFDLPDRDSFAKGAFAAGKAPSGRGYAPEGKAQSVKSIKRERKEPLIKRCSVKQRRAPPKDTGAGMPPGKTAGAAQVSAQWRIAIKCGGKISGTAEPFWAPCNIHATALTLFFPCDSMKMHTVA